MSTKHEEKYGLTETEDDPFINRLVRLIHFAVRVLAVLMTAVIFWGLLDVVWMLYQKLTAPPYFLLNINDILATFGAFLAVLIAIEIFVNITMYLRDDIIHVELVLATALMAIARKVIIFDFTKHSAGHIIGTAAVIAALGLTYWLVCKQRPGAGLTEAASEDAAETD